MKTRIRSLLFLSGLSLGFLGLTASPSLAGSVEITGAGGSFSVGVTSIREARFNSVIRQAYDFSCGSAAVATLLTFHYGVETKEREVFDAMYEAGDKDLIETAGFSLLDMKDYLNSRGFKADGYRVSLEKLGEVGIPAIVLVNVRGYLHFVVIKGIEDDRVLVGDPALGVKTYDVDEFRDMWNGIVFVINQELNKGRDSFNQSEIWAVNQTAPFGTALNLHKLASFTLHLPRVGDF
ncbi:MAG: C39 family peptidase [Marinovum algicola]|uniref:C39 family peptidase n=1 Tax=Marinovum algicola TaxID=42444 RepID=UPI0032EBEF9C